MRLLICEETALSPNHGCCSVPGTSTAFISSYIPKRNEQLLISAPAPYLCVFGKIFYKANYPAWTFCAFRSTELKA